MSKNTPTIAQSLATVFDSRLAALHVAMPARVESYDASQQRATVQPLTRRAFIAEDDSRTPEKLPPIEGVPIIFPGAGAYKITFPIAKGDIVMLLFAEGSIDKWLTTGAVDVDPDDDRRNALSDAVAIPGLLPFKNPSDQVDDDAMVISAPELKLGSKDATELVSFKSALDKLLTAMDTWTVVATDGGAALKASLVSAYGASGWSSVGSTKVKVE